MLYQDSSANEKIYGRKVEAEDIVRKNAVPVPPAGEELVALLNKKTPKSLSNPKSLQ